MPTNRKHSPPPPNLPLAATHHRQRQHMAHGASNATTTLCDSPSPHPTAHPQHKTLYSTTHHSHMQSTPPSTGASIPLPPTTHTYNPLTNRQRTFQVPPPTHNRLPLHQASSTHHPDIHATPRRHKHRRLFCFCKFSELYECEPLCSGHLNRLVRAMRRVDLEPNEMVITQGDIKADCCYICGEECSLEVLINGTYLGAPCK